MRRQNRKIPFKVGDRVKLNPKYESNESPCDDFEHGKTYVVSFIFTDGEISLDDEYGCGCYADDCVTKDMEECLVSARRKASEIIKELKRAKA